MAENLGQIDVVIQSDNQSLTMPDVGKGVGKPPQGLIGPPRPESLGGTGVPGDLIGKGKALANKRLAMLAKVAAVAGAVAAVFIAVKKVISLFIDGVLIAIRTLQKWDSEIQGLIENLATLNGSAALAQSITRLGEFTSNLKKAKILGPMLLQMTKARESFMKVKGAVTAAFDAIKITVLEAFFRVASSLIQPLIDSMGGIEGLTKAARVCTIALLKLAALAMKPIGWLTKIASFFTGGFIGGNILGLVGNTLLTISDRLDDAVNEIKKQSQDAATREDMKAIIDANAMTLGHLEHMTGGLWRHGTQVPLQAATGRTMNPRQWAEREAAKKQRRTL